MLRILSADYVQKRIWILKDGSEISVTYNPDSDSSICFNSGKQISAGCINCVNPRCMYLRNEDIGCGEFSGISYDMSKLVCPVNAIKSGEERIEIDENKCMGCGLCVVSCPVGALYLKGGKARISVGDRKHMQELSVNDAGIKEQNKFIQNIVVGNGRGRLCRESDCVMESVYKGIRKMSQREQNILARNLLIRLGNQATLARQGNVYMRMDGFYSNSRQMGTVEIETGTDMLDVSRAILDDVAVMNVRYGIEKERNHPLAICLNLPNKRTDYWQVVKDIRDIVKISICTVTFGALFILMWNNKEIIDFDRFYIDVDNSSIRKDIVRILGRNIHISDGFYGILENWK